MPSKGGSEGAPGGSASPTGRIPQERSRLPIQTSGSTAICSPSTAIVPLHAPSWANRCASSVTRLPERSTCGSSWTASQVASQVRSSDIPSVSSRTMRSLRRGSGTSMR